MGIDRRGTGRLLLGAAALAALLSGCSTMDESAGDAEPTAVEQEGESSDGSKKPRTYDKAEDGMATPHKERPGTPARRDGEPEALVEFTAPEWPGPLPDDERPEPADSVSLGVVQVRASHLRRANATLVELDALLGDEDALTRILGVRPKPTSKKIDLPGLLAQAEKAKHQLLLVDMRESEKRRPRTGYLLVVPSGGLLCTWSVGKDDEPPGEEAESEAELDLYDRIALAYARLAPTKKKKKTK